MRPSPRLRGRLRVPGDKSITHRALLIGALAEGQSLVEGGSDGLDCNSTAACLTALGVRIERLGEAPGGRIDRRIRSPGRAGLRLEPGQILDCGNSGTTLRLLAGVLAGTSLQALLDGDASLRRRPVARIIEPLRSMGAGLSAREADTVPPLSVHGRSRLRPIDYTTRVPSAQVKSAILLAALVAEGTTTVRESVATRDHTERMLGSRGVRIDIRQGNEGERAVSVEGMMPVRAMDERVPGDLSAAAFFLVAGAAHPDAEVTIEGVGVNPTRRAVLDILRRMGADLDERTLPAQGAEPAANVTVRSSDLRGIDLGPRDVAGAIDEIPILCLAAAAARGRTVIRGATELRHKESDRLGGMAAGLAALGVPVEVEGDDLTIDGRPGGLVGTDLKALGDHRLAMTWAVAGLLAPGGTVISGAGSVDVSHPGFFADLERLHS